MVEVVVFFCVCLLCVSDVGWAVAWCPPVNFWHATGVRLDSGYYRSPNVIDR